MEQTVYTFCSIMRSALGADDRIVIPKMIQTIMTQRMTARRQHFWISENIQTYGTFKSFKSRDCTFLILSHVNF